ncbi:MAG: pitrilysin family protein [Acidobacteriota bacterium]
MHDHDLTLDLPLERHTLDNGLRVVLHSDRALPLICVNLWYHVGSKHERPGMTGFAHLFEHLLFEGSAHVGPNEHFRHVQRAGGNANGSTWYDRTNYYETLPSNQLDLGLWLESDRLGFFLPAISQHKLDMQREVVINERRQRVDNQPYGRAIEVLYETLLPEAHPYRWPVIGYVEDIERATLDQVRTFFQTHYVPNNAVLTVAGDLDGAGGAARVLDRIAHFFGEIPPGAPPPPPPVPFVQLDAARRVELPDRVQLPRVYVGATMPAYGDDAWYAGDLLSTALTSGKTSPLYVDLVYERQLAQDVVCYVLPLEEQSTFTMIATCRPGVEAAALESALHAHLDRAAASPPADADLERSQNQNLMMHFRALQNLDHRADALSRATTFFDDPHRVATEAQRLQRLGGDDVTAFAAAYLRPEQRATVVVVPQEAA